MIDQVIAWQSRPLDAAYPILYLDCIVLRIRQDKCVINKSIYLALGTNTRDHKELLGMGRLPKQKVQSSGLLCSPNYNSVA